MLSGAVALVGANPALADTTPTYNGTNWLYGDGVNVCGPSTDGTCGGQEHVGGVSSNWWQCVELPQRLYYDRGWYTANGGIFSGVSYAYQIWDDASSLGMTTKAQGSITSLAPGDMIVYYYSSSDPSGYGSSNSNNVGHVAVVNTINGSTVTAMEQNFNGGADEATYTWNGGSLARTAPDGGTVDNGDGYALPIKGIVHSPNDELGSGGTSPGVGFYSTYMGDQLDANQSLYGNQYIMSDDNRFLLILQDDGNVVLYGPGYTSLWSSATGGDGGTQLLMQSDGNLVLYGSHGAVWSSATSGTSANELLMQNDGNAVLYGSGYSHSISNTGGHSASPYSYAGSNQLTTNGYLSPNTYLRSGDHRYVFLFQSNGYVTLLGPAFVQMWQTNVDAPSGTTATEFILGNDGNLVAYDTPGGAYWSSATSGTDANQFLVQNDGNAVLYTSSGSVWSTGTAGQT